MKHISLAAYPIIMFTIFSTALYASDSKNISLLQKYCDYSLSEEIKSTIKETLTNTHNNIYTETNKITLTVNNKNIQGALAFTCFMPEDKPTNESYADLRSATEIINSEDTGGRYARIIKWSSEFSGNGWTGTAAYSNSIFGDGEAYPMNGTIYICPKPIKSPCFSFESEERKLDISEIKEIINFISSIYHTK